MTIPPLIILIGLPASGKSTLVHQWLLNQPSQVLISTDAIRAQLFGDEAVQGAWGLIWREVERQFQQAVQDITVGMATTAIYDATNTVRRHRRELIVLARARGFGQLTGVWLDVPLELCLSRNQHRHRHVPEAVICRMHRRLVGAPPSLTEGFDRLIRYTAFNSPRSLV